MTLSRTLAAVLLLAAILPAHAEDFFYRLTTHDIQEGSNYEVYVKSDLSPTDLMAKMKANDPIRFSESYAWLDAAKRWGTWSEWDDLFTGELIVMGSNIIVAQRLVGSPLTHTSKNKEAEHEHPQSASDKAKNF